MSEPQPTQKSKPLKTWSHLQKARRRPNEYEIVSTNNHFSTDTPECPWELDENVAANQWFRRYREGSPLTHPDWDGFRDPDEVVYRTYNIVQDGQESYIDGLLADFHDREHDAGLEHEWVEALALLYTPGRYLLHAQQMAIAYLTQIAPASTISNCAAFQSGDRLRWLSHTAYRTRELANTWNGFGFVDGERTAWEQHEAWQGFRELMERALVAYDWGESFTALNLVAIPAADEVLFRQLGYAARTYRDDLLSLMCDAALRDVDRHRRWTAALARYMLEQDSNLEVLETWVGEWVPLADAAIDAYCAALPDRVTAADEAKREAWTFRAGLGLSA